MRRSLADYIQRRISSIIKDDVEAILRSRKNGNLYLQSSDDIKSAFINRVARMATAQVTQTQAAQIMRDIVSRSQVEAGYAKLLKSSNELYAHEALYRTFNDMGIMAASSGETKRINQYRRNGKIVTSTAKIGSDDLLFQMENLTKDIIEQIKGGLGQTKRQDLILGKDWDKMDTQHEQDWQQFTSKMKNAAVQDAFSKAMGVNEKSWADFEKRNMTNRIDTSLLRHGMSLGHKSIGYVPNNKGGYNTKPYIDNLTLSAKQAINILGVRNVIFATGSKFYFMDQFIEEFLARKLFIQVETHWDKIPEEANHYWVVNHPNAQELNYNKWRQFYNIW